MILKKQNYVFIYSLIFLLMFSIHAHADKYTMVIEPTYPIEQAKQVYAPLSQWLSKKTGHEIEIIIDNNYYFYWSSAKGSRVPDFVLDAAHIASFRSKKKNYKILATTIEPITFHLISLDEPAKDQSVNNFLISKAVAMLPHPSLANIYFKQWFPDLFSSPNKNIKALSWEETVEIVFNGGAEAAIVPHWIYNQYPNFVSLLESKKIPGTTFLASPNVPNDVVEIFKDALISLKDDKDAYNVLVELNTEGFKEPKIENFDMLIKLLPDFF